MTTKELYDHVKSVSEFLINLSKIGKYKFRRTIRLSDVELQEIVEKDSAKILASVRDVVIYHDFIADKGLIEEFEKYHNKIMGEIKAVMEKENVK